MQHKLSLPGACNLWRRQTFSQIIVQANVKHNSSGKCHKGRSLGAMRACAGRICLDQGGQGKLSISWDLKYTRVITPMNFVLQSSILWGHTLISNNAALANNSEPIYKHAGPRPLCPQIKSSCFNLSECFVFWLDRDESNKPHKKINCIPLESLSPIAKNGIPLLHRGLYSPRAGGEGFMAVCKNKLTEGLPWWSSG